MKCFHPFPGSTKLDSNLFWIYFSAENMICLKYSVLKLSTFFIVIVRISECDVVTRE